MSASASSIDAPPLRDFREELAEAYRRAALAGGDMYRTVSAIEAVRSVLSDRRTGLRALDALDDQVALAEDETLRTVLDDLRTAIKQAILEEQRAQLESLARESPETAASEWMQAYGAALRFWRIDVCENLSAIPVELGNGLPSRDEMARWTRLLVHERYAETLDLFLLLGEHTAYDPQQRAKFLVNAAQIHLYHILDYPAALELIHQAEELAPDDPTVIMAIGEHRLETGDVEGAKEQFAKVMSSDEAAEASRLMGDAHEQAGELDEAERWFVQAIGYGPGQPSSYMRLASLYGRRATRASDDLRFQSLIERAIAADPRAEYSVCVTIGGVHAGAGGLDVARSWYERAIALDPTRIRAYVADGYGLSEADRFDEAERAFLQAIELAPEAFDGHWGLAWLHERTGRFEEALDGYHESLARRPSWREVVVARIGATLRALGRLDEAEEKLLGELSVAREGDAVLAELHDLATELYERHEDPDRARRLLERIREIKGDTYESSFQNRLGNLEYWYENYDAAAEAYRRSLDAAPSDAVVHRNLAAAYRELRLWDEARNEVQQAFDLDHDEAEESRAKALVHNAQGNAFFADEDYESAREWYERALELEPSDAVMQMNLALAWRGIWRPGQRRAALEAARVAAGKSRELDARSEDAGDQERMIDFELRLLDRLGEPEWTGVPPRIIAVEVADDLVPFVAGEGPTGLTEEAQAASQDFRDRIRRRTDLLPPGIRFASSVDFPPARYELRLLESFCGSGSIEAGALLVPGEAEVLRRHGVEPRAAFPGTEAPAWWVDASDADRLRSEGLDVLEPVPAMLLHLEAVLIPLLEAPASPRT